MARPFLTARWEHLIFLSYRCPASLLAPLVPAGTTLDPWHGDTFVSLVAFLFRDTRIGGLAVPFHRTFEEVNLRFYVRRLAGDETRRGVVFIRELVPRRAIALVARWAYNEPYAALPMRHDVQMTPGAGGSMSYMWTHPSGRCSVRARVDGPPILPAEDSPDAFITEHYWGYTRQRDGGTLEYEVQHPQWPVWTPVAWSLDGPVEAVYGPELGRILQGRPDSVLAAEGSDVRVYPGRPVR